MLGDVTDGRRSRCVSADREQELVVGGCDAVRNGLLLAPMQEASQLITESEQTFVVGVGERVRHVVLRYLHR